MPYIRELSRGMLRRFKTDAGVGAGWLRAQKLYPHLGKCQLCDNRAVERHHIDGNTLNNEPGNVMFLCRHHHMEVDGRLEQISYRLAHRSDGKQLQVPKPCSNCGQPYFPLRKGLCHACNEYYRRHGVHRTLVISVNGHMRQPCHFPSGNIGDHRYLAP